MHDKLLVKIFITTSNQISPKLHYIFKDKYGYANKYKNIKHYIETRYPDSSSYQETIKRMQYGVEVHPLCYCGKPVKFIGKKDKLFGIYCSNSCRSKLINKQIWINGQKEYNKIHYGVEHNFQRKECIEKRKETLIEKYGTKNLSSVDTIKSKIQKTLQEKYDVTNFSEFVSLPDVREKINATFIANNSFTVSKDEEFVYQHLCDLYNKENIIRQYRSDVYPFKCDFYIKPFDLYIEYNGSQYHHGHPFDETNEEDVNELHNLQIKAEQSPRHLEGKKSQYDTIIYTWTNLDVRKRNIAKQNHLNFIEIWNMNDLYKLFVYIPQNADILQKEYQTFKTKKGVLSNTCNANQIIKYFQQDTFFAVEKELFQQEETRNKLLENRIKYIHTNILSADQILTGFKKSGIHYGYSHFNPLLFKWFIEKYNVKTCYDPCGGWGHRLLGASNLDLYIYNDLSKHTKENVDKIIQYFSIENTHTYCEDANTFRPQETYEAMFTCPPYFNVEHYECGDFENDEKYYEFIDNLFDCFYTSDANLFGLIIREDCLQDKWKSKAIETYDISVKKSHLIKTKTYNEYLYVFKKQ